MERESFKRGKEYIGVGVCYFCHDGKGNFVMALRGKNARDENGRWDIGGGGVEFGDTVEETLRKEIKEEYGTDVLEAEFLGFRDVMRVQDGKQTHWVVFDFKVLVNRAQVKNGEPAVFDEVKWFRLDTLPYNVHSQLPFTLEKYRSRLDF